MKCEKCNASNLEINLRCRLCGHGFNENAPRVLKDKSSKINNESWLKSYRKMKMKYEILRTVNSNNDLLKGYEMCMECFEKLK